MITVRSMVLVLLASVLVGACGAKTPTSPSKPVPPAPSGPVKAVSLAITGNLGLNIGETTQLTATVTFSDSSTKDVTAESVWVFDRRHFWWHCRL